MTFKFGDVLQNGCTSPENPYSKCIFLRKTKKFIHVMHFDGSLSDFYNDRYHGLSKVGSIINDDEMKRFKQEMKLKDKKYREKLQEVKG